MKPTKERVVLDDMTVFMLWESFIASGKSKDDCWRWKIAQDYAKKIFGRPASGREITKVYMKMNDRFKNFVKLGLYDVFIQKGNGKKIYSLRETDIVFKKVRFADGKLSRALTIRIDD